MAFSSCSASYSVFAFGELRIHTYVCLSMLHAVVNGPIDVTKFWSIVQFGTLTNLPKLCIYVCVFFVHV